MTWCPSYIGYASLCAQWGSPPGLLSHNKKSRCNVCRSVLRSLSSWSSAILSLTFVQPRKSDSVTLDKLLFMCNTTSSALESQLDGVSRRIQHKVLPSFSEYVSGWLRGTVMTNLCPSRKVQRSFQALSPRTDDNFDTDVSCLSSSDMEGGLPWLVAAQAASQQRYMRNVRVGVGGVFKNYPICGSTVG